MINPSSIIDMTLTNLYAVFFNLPSIGLQTPSSISIDTALANLSNAFDNIKGLILAISYIIGLALLVRGVMMYKAIATQTMASAQRGEFAGPLVHIVVGSIMIYYPSTLSTAMFTVFGTGTSTPASSLLGYSSLTGAEQWQKFGTVLVDYVYLVGLVAFMRGWVILSKMGHAGSQPGSMGKGIIHVVGGILLINVVDTANIIMSTFGYAGG